MANEISDGNRYFTGNGDEIDTSNLTQYGKAQLANIRFVDEQLTQKNNERQIADSARVVYVSVLKSELNKIKSTK